jgi:hypothetical protein
MSAEPVAQCVLPPAGQRSLAITAMGRFRGSLAGSAWVTVIDCSVLATMLVSRCSTFTHFAGRAPP